jgi:diacylglycerol kinase (ATP)
VSNSSFFKKFQADINLNDIAELPPSLLLERGIKGVIFDLDDTLIAEHTGKLSEKIVNALEAYKAAGLKTGIITNNFSSRYCEKVRNLLAQDNLFIPMIENAYKPQTLCFEQMIDFFDLPANQVAMVGDGIVTDTYGAKKAGLLSIRVNWFSRNTLKKGFLLVLRELIVCAYDVVRRLLFGHKSTQYHMFKNTTANSYLFLVNPKSSQTNLQAIKELIGKHFESASSGANYKIHECHEFENLSSIFANDIKNGVYSCVVAVGGDGTVREAISLIQNNWSVVLGIIPTGTGNLLAKSLSIPNEPSEALKIFIEGKQKRIDITKVNNCYITLVVGAGLDANIMKNTTSDKKKLLGILAYCVEALRQVVRSKRAWFVLEIDGKKYWKKAVGIIAINRNSYIQAFIPQLKMPEENNGLLDVCILKAETSGDYFAILAELFLGAYKEKNSKIEHFQAKTLKVRSVPLLNVQADGDYIGKTPLNIKILPNQLAVYVP